MKKLLSLLLVIFMAVCILPVTALAASSTSSDVKVLGTSVSKDKSENYTTYWKYTDGSLTESGASADDYNVSYFFDSSANTGKLTLNNLTASYSNGNYIYLKTTYPITINLIGTNTLSEKSGYSVDIGIRSYGPDTMYAGKKVSSITFTGSGSLDMTCHKYAVNSYRESGKNGTLTVNGGNLIFNLKSNSDDKVGFYGEAYSQNGGTVTINIDGTDGAARGINVEQAVSINEGTLDITMKTESSSAGSITAIKAGSNGISFGSKASSKIVINTNRTGAKVMTQTPTISNGVTYSANADGSSPTVLPATADSSARAAIASSPVRFFETSGITKYTVTYTDGVNGTAFKDAVFTVKENDSTPAYNNGTDPVREGYAFDGWDPSVAEKVTQDATYTAKWTKLHTVKYQDGVSGTVFKEEKHAVRDNEEIPAYNNGTAPKRTGYEFKGWDPAYVEGAKATEDITYVAQWEELYTVKYTDGVTDKVFEDEIYDGLHKGDATPAFKGKPIRENYSFEGWDPAVTEKVTGNTVYTAKWKEIKTNDEVQVFNQIVSLDSDKAYTTYWKAIDVDDGHGGKITKLFASDDKDYNVSYQYDPVKNEGTLTLKNLKTEHACPASTPQSYIFTKTDKKINLVLSGTNKIGYNADLVTVNNAISCYGKKDKEDKTVIGELEISGTGSLETTTNRYGIDSANGEGKVTIKSGDIKLHVIANGQGATGIRALDYKQDGGNVVLDVQDSDSTGAANCTGICGKVTEPYTPGNFVQNDGTLNIKVKTAAQAFGIIGYKNATLGDQADCEIILDNIRKDGSDNWTRLFGLGDDNQNQKMDSITLGNDSVYAGIPYPTEDEWSTIGKDENNDLLQYLGTAEAKDKLHYFHQGIKKYTVTYNDGVADKVIFEDEVHSGLSKNSDTPVYNNGTDPKRTGYVFEAFYDKDGNEPAEKVTEDITYFAKWSPISYTVVFDKNDDIAIGSMDDETFKYDEKKALNTNLFIKKNARFLYWTLNADGTGPKFMNKEEVVNLASEDGAVITLYAQWKTIEVPSRPVEPDVKPEVKPHTNPDTGSCDNPFLYISVLAAAAAISLTEIEKKKRNSEE